MELDVRNKIDNLFDAILTLEDLLTLPFQLEESTLIQKYYKRHFIEAETEEEKTWVNFDAKELLRKANSYKNILKHYSDNYERYDII